MVCQFKGINYTVRYSLYRIVQLREGTILRDPRKKFLVNKIIPALDNEPSSTELEIFIISLKWNIYSLFATLTITVMLYPVFS